VFGLLFSVSERFCSVLRRLVVMGRVMLERHIFAQLLYSLFFDVCFSMVLFMALFFV
jgi:hypothetical protein